MDEKKTAVEVLTELKDGIVWERAAYAVTEEERAAADEKIKALNAATDALQSKKIRIETDAGVLEAEDCSNDFWPGICLGFIPKGETEYIDLARIESPFGEDGLNGQVPGTLSLYVYGDIRDEDYTEKIVFPPDEVKAALNDSYWTGGAAL